MEILGGFYSSRFSYSSTYSQIYTAFPSLLFYLFHLSIYNTTFYFPSHVYFPIRSITALERQKQKDLCELQDSQYYTEPVSKQQKQKSNLTALSGF